MTGIYRVAGMRIASSIPLDAIAVDGGPVADLVVSMGPTRAVPRHPPEGQVVADHEQSGKALSIRRTEDRHLIRYHGVCDVELDRALRKANVVLDPTVPPGIAAMLITGTTLAYVLLCRKATVLHASAVTVDGDAIAIAGPSGVGKSTLAGLLCAGGASFHSDDLLRLEHDESTVSAHGGGNLLRLRTGAAVLAEAMGTPEATADGRTGLRFAAPSPLPRVRSILFPQPSRTADRPRLHRTAKPEALGLLLLATRVPGLSDPQLRSTEFAALAEVARRVPVHLAEIPWGPPFAPELAPELLEALRTS